MHRRGAAAWLLWTASRRATCHALPHTYGTGTLRTAGPSSVIESSVPYVCSCDVLYQLLHTALHCTACTRSGAPRRPHTAKTITKHRLSVGRRAPDNVRAYADVIYIRTK